MHLRDDVDAAHLELVAARRTQRHVQHGPPFRVVDLLACGHRPDLGLQPCRLRQREQQLHCLGGEALPRVVEEDAIVLDLQSRYPSLVRDELSQVE